VDQPSRGEKADKIGKLSYLGNSLRYYYDSGYLDENVFLAGVEFINSAAAELLREEIEKVRAKSKAGRKPTRLADLYNMEAGLSHG